MKNTIAHGENFHLYEEFGIKGGLFLQVYGVTLFLEKDVLKGILPALQRLEANKWEFIGEEDVTTEQIDGFIDVLKKMKAKKNAVTAEFLADLEGEAVPFASNPKHINKYTNKYVMEDWQPEDEEEE